MKILIQPLLGCIGGVKGGRVLLERVQPTRATPSFIEGLAAVSSVSM